MRLSFTAGLCAGALGLAAAACGLKLDVSRISGLSATFDLARDPGAAILPECRLVVPQVAPEADPALVRFTRRFEFGGAERAIAVDVDARLLAAARTIGSERCVMSELDADEFYESVVFDPAEEPFFEALLGQLRALRAELRLVERSRYVELLVAFVQSLDYEVGESMPKHPIAAFADGVGDCDEKSALLAGLLAREGYDVSLLLFLEEQHMAVGLRAAGLDYRDTGYAYVEATRRSSIGHSAGGPEGPVPEVLEMGGGELEYAPSREQIYLDLAARRAWDRIRAGRASPEEAAVDAVVYLTVAARSDLAEAFAAVSAVVHPVEDALIREAMRWPAEGGAASRRER